MKVLPKGRKAFVALKNPETAGLEEVSSLYTQAANVAGVAYLLYSAAAPLAEATPGALIGGGGGAGPGGVAAGPLPNV